MVLYFVPVGQTEGVQLIDPQRSARRWSCTERELRVWSPRTWYHVAPCNLGWGGESSTAFRGRMLNQSVSSTFTRIINCDSNIWEDPIWNEVDCEHEPCRSVLETLLQKKISTLEVGFHLKGTCRSQDRAKFKTVRQSANS